MADIARQEVTQCKTRMPLNTIRREAEQAPDHADFMKAVSQTLPDHIGIIAEIKKASPSKGYIKPDLDPVLFAGMYEEGGACAISVLTEPHFFKGSMADLKAVCAATDLPVLRKEFIISDYQIYEARKAGADAVLLITALLSRDQLSEYILLTKALNMAPLVEIHSEKELETACYCEAKLIGVNNRNLSTLKTDRTVSKRIGPIIPKDITAVEASGITSREDIKEGLAGGFHNFLVGESIVTAPDPAAFIQSLLKTDASD
jgi:indole-3-glycerol phosphate synthase